MLPMDTMKMVHCHTFFLPLVVGSWQFRGSLLPICSILLDLSGKSKLYFSGVVLFFN